MGVKIRLHGAPAEVDLAAARLARVFTVDQVSTAYRDRGASGLVRVYVDIRDPYDTHDTATEPGRGEHQ